MVEKSLRELVDETQTHESVLDSLRNWVLIDKSRGAYSSSPYKISVHLATKTAQAPASHFWCCPRNIATYVMCQKREKEKGRGEGPYVIKVVILKPHILPKKRRST